MRTNILLIVLLACAVSAFTAPREPSPREQWEPGFARMNPRDHRVVSLDEDSLHVYDAVKFSPHLTLDFASHIISGYVLINLTTPESALDRVDFRFTHSLTIDSVWAEGNYSATLTSDGNDSIQVLLSPSLQPGDTMTIGVAYHGNPAIIDSWGGYRWASVNSWQPEIAFSMGDGLDIDPPPANYAWIPSYADPNDKAVWEAWFRVPTGKTVSTNGLRIDTTNHGDNSTTWHYRLDQPVSTYLYFISAADYLIQVQRESGPRIENFVYPSRWSQAQVHFSNVPTVLDSFVSRFGPYPFARMGYNMTRIGDMEHATCVSHIDVVVNANHIYDWLLFHEMAHMWWGNWVTCGDWRDLWLNEGFGTYCEALSMEALGGYNAYHDYVVINLFPDARAATDSYSIYDPDYYWGATVYEKGACVMHMLRMILGDSTFFSALREYGQEHAFATAITPDWQAKLEEHYGGSLDWFFQPWVYGTRFPRYRVVLQPGDTTVMRIDQIQTTPTLFRMPMDVLVVTASNDTAEFTVWNEAGPSQSYTLFPNDSLGLPGIPMTVVIDPYDKILKTAVYQYLTAEEPLTLPPSSFRLSAYPNPFNPATTITLELPQTSPVQLRVFNLLGREVDHTDLGSMHAGRHSIPFDGRHLPSGVYLFSIESNIGTRFTKAVLLK